MKESEVQVIARTVSKSINGAIAPLQKRLTALEMKQAGRAEDFAPDDGLSQRQREFLDAVDEHVRELLKEMGLSFSKRLTELEMQQNEFKYVGVWNSGRPYRKGNFATHAGAVWHCDEDTKEPPARSNAWTLAVKSGR